MSKFVSFLKKSFKYISLSAIGLVIVASLIGFVSHQYGEYMSRPDEQVGFICEPETEAEESFYMIIESSKESRSGKGYYDGVKILDVAFVPNSEEAYLFWDKDYSAARTQYEIFIVSLIFIKLE